MTVSSPNRPVLQNSYSVCLSVISVADMLYQLKRLVLAGGAGALNLFRGTKEVFPPQPVVCREGALKRLTCAHY